MLFNYIELCFSIVPLNHFGLYLVVTAQGGICLILERKCCLYKQSENGLRHGEEEKDSKAKPLTWEREPPRAGCLGETLWTALLSTLFSETTG